MSEEPVAGEAHPHEHHDHEHHGHGHHHHAPIPAGGTHDRAFAIAVGVNFLYVLVEVGSGLFSGSLALIADAGHNLGDVLGLALAWGAAHLGRRVPSERHTYGLKRSSILASLANSIILMIGVGAIAVEALQRLLFTAHAVAPKAIILVSLLGILVNGATSLLFHRGHKDDLNIRAAFVHLASDALVSLGVAATGVVIVFTGLNWLDPVASLAIALIITLGTWSLLRDSLDLALDAVPANVDPAAVEAYLRTLPGVTDIHDLHIWPLSTTETALTAHLIRPGEIDDALISTACRELQKRFKIGHATFQLERGDQRHPCGLATSESL